MISITYGLGLFLQGYHDVASVLLLLMGENNAYMMLEKLSLYHLKYPSLFDPIYIYIAVSPISIHIRAYIPQCFGQRLHGCIA